MKEIYFQLSFPDYLKTFAETRSLMDPMEGSSHHYLDKEEGSRVSLNLVGQHCSVLDTGQECVLENETQLTEGSEDGEEPLGENTDSFCE